MKDLITRKQLEYRVRSEETIEGLTYTDAQKIPTKLVIEILKVLSEDDIKRYSELINEIEELSIKEYRKKKKFKAK